jgi:hypothetical protein
MLKKCACDVCTTPALTSDGYCEFCAKKCFPPGKMGNREIRISMKRESRVLLHSQSSRTADLREQAARAAIRALTPFVEQGGKSLLDAVRKRIVGR